MKSANTRLQEQTVKMISNKEKNNNILLDSLIRYVLPIFNKKAKDKKKQSKLEELVKKEKSITKPLELIFLEELVDSFLRNKSDGIKTIKKIRTPDIEINNNASKNDESEIKYSIALERKKESRDNAAYSVEIKYEENENEEKLKVKVKIDNYSLDKNPLQKNNLKDNKEYSFIITKQKENKTKDNYSVSLIYENNYEKERLSIDYKSTRGTYLNRRQEALHDFSDRVPGKSLETFPVSGNEGLYGFTYLGDIKIWRRDDLSGKFAKMVDIHESIHTPDEYETRILTDWIMTKQTVKYIK